MDGSWSSGSESRPPVSRERGSPEVAAKPERAAIAEMSVTGIVLAGGRSVRMGSDKAWSDLAGRPLIAWVIDAVRRATTHQLVVAREVGRFAQLGVPLVLDRYEARGPITGIHAGLREAPTDLCVIVACDLPLVRPQLLSLLAGALGQASAAVPYVPEHALPKPSADSVARDAGPQPLLAGYRSWAAALLEPLIDRGPVPTTALIGVLKATMVPPEVWREADPDGRSFFNVNTSEDLAEAARRLAAGS